MFEATKLNLKAAKVAFRLARTAQGPFSYRFNLIKKYYPFYVHHITVQKTKFNLNLLQMKKETEEQAHGNKIKSLYQKYAQKLKSQMDQKASQLKSKQVSEYEKQARNLLHSGMSYLSLYYESLQNIIQGRRQVLYNSQFTFQDGKTVDQKRIAFEKYLSRLLGRKPEEIDRIEEEYQRKKQSQVQR